MPTPVIQAALAPPTARYAVRAYTATPLPTARERHMLNRMGTGYTLRALRQMRRIGGPLKWFEWQLNPEAILESPMVEQFATFYPSVAWSPTERRRQNKLGREAWIQGRDLANLTVLRQAYSQRQLLEQMAAFWANHFYVPAHGNSAWPLRANFDQALRSVSLGSFEQVLLTATLHPAMLMSLDNALSTRAAPNENHGRELLELHTVGRTGGYSETMVKDSARILSGFTVDENSLQGWYDSGRHWVGPVSVMGFSHANNSADGQEVARAYLRHLARHPATARRICRKLAIRFVSDAPSEQLVSDLAAVYLANGTDIKATLRALVRHPEFLNSVGQKVRTPYEDQVATLRALNPVPQRSDSANAFIHALNWTHGALPVYFHATPDGHADVAAAWTSVNRMLASFQMHWNFSGAYWPSVGVTWRRPTSFLPSGVSTIRLDALVDHWSRLWLGRSSTPALLQAVSETTALPPFSEIKAGHPVLTWMFPRVACVFFDNPAHMTR